MNKLLVYILLVLMALIGFMSWATYEASQTLKGEERARNQATLTLEVLGDIRQILLAGINAETGKRGYLLSQDKAYLEPYYAGRRDYVVALEHLKASISGKETPLQADLIPRLEEAMKKKFLTLDKTIKLVDSGQLNAALAILNTNRGKEFMDEARSITAQMEIEERKILRAALEAADRQDRRFKTYIAWIGAAITALMGVSVLLIWRAAKADEAEAHVSELQKAQERTELIARELNHRVKNLFSIVISIIRNTGRMETDAKAATEKILDRVHALSKAHELTISSEGLSDTTIQTLVESVIDPHSSDRHTYKLINADIVLPSFAITPLGLIIHELATNAVKYGAWSLDGPGHIDIEFHSDAIKSDVGMMWIETGGPMPEEAKIGRKGFGSKMMTLSAKQLNGELKTIYPKKGIEVSANFKFFLEQ